MTYVFLIRVEISRFLLAYEVKALHLALFHMKDKSVNLFNVLKRHDRVRKEKGKIRKEYGKGKGKGAPYNRPRRPGG